MKSYTTTFIITASLLTTAFTTKAQNTNNDLLDLLVQKKVVTEQEADSIRAGNKQNIIPKKISENQHGISLGKALQISGLIQARYQAYQQSGINNSFDLHRARLDVKGTLTSNWSYEIYTEFAGTTKLLDAYTTYRIADFLKFTAGQFKVPFSVESLTSDADLEFIDRSQVVEALVARTKDVIGNQVGRDIGAQVSGSFLKVNREYLFDYTFAVLNGAGYDVTADNNQSKDIDGRLGIHPIKGLDIGADFYNGVGVWGAPPKNQTRDRRGVDARYVYGPLSVTAEYDEGKDSAITRNGWYAQAAYFVLPQRLQLAAKIDDYNPNEAISNDLSTWYIVGANYYFNNWARLAVNYSIRQEQVKQIKNNVLETQLQITF